LRITLDSYFGEEHKKKGLDYLPPSSLAAKYPKLAAQWHPRKNRFILPIDVTPGSGKKVWWICKKGHEWLTSVAHRTKGRGCPYCAGKKASLNYNLAVKFPNVAKQWHPFKNGAITPIQILPKSGKKFWWLCEHAHEWQAVVQSRTRGNGCPFCSRRFPTKDNNLSIKFPKIASEWHPTKNKISPEQVKPGSNKKVWWLCDCGYEYQAMIYNRTKNRSGCPQCRKEKMRQLRYEIALKKSVAP
jgi:Zn finger protein HypA/HybF involved in hydrogenase expression